MQLVFDVGNTATKAALFDGDRLVHAFQVVLDEDDAAEHLNTALRRHLDAPPDQVGLVSVVPRRTDRLLALLERLGYGTPVVVSSAMRLPFTLAYETPRTLGTDRLAAAAAAWIYYRPDDGRGVVALDAGTAVTYDVVEAGGVFRGGAIAAGPHLIREALSHGTAQLPEVPLVLPPDVIGCTTAYALQSGLMYGFIDSVGGMLARIERRMGARPFVVATGGWSSLLQHHLPAIDHVAPHLVLHGVRLLMQYQSAPGRLTDTDP